MKTILLSLAFLMPVAFAADGWETDMAAAKKKAADEGKGLLIEFTGSDWCPPCKYLKKSLVKEEFLTAAQKSFVLVELDYPRQKQLSPELTAQNKKAAEDYGITGYPTVVFADAEGRPVHAFVGGRDLQEVLAEVGRAEQKKAEVEPSVKALGKLEGREHYDALAKIVDVVPVKYLPAFYPDVVEGIKTASDDPAGLKVKLLGQKQGVEMDAFLRQALRDTRGDRKKYIEHIQTYLEEHEDLVPPVRQKAMITQARFFYGLQQLDEAITTLDAALALDPETEEARQQAPMLDYWKTNKDTIALTMTQRMALRKYESSLDREQKSDPGAYARAMDQYLTDHKDLTPDTRNAIMQDLFFALIADDRFDEGLARIQQEIDGMPKDANGEKATKTLGLMKQNAVENRDEFAKSIKQYWEQRYKAISGAQTP